MDRGIVIEVEALLGSADEPLVQRRVRTGFIQGKFLVVRMLLYRACTDMICAEGESCGCEDAAACLAPFCVDEFVDPKNLEVTDNPAVLPPNPGIPIDPDVTDCEPLTLCGTECVDTDSDPLFCGNCTTACSSGEVCVEGACIEPGDCRTNGIDCSGFTYCDEVTGTCLRGCEANEQCGSSETCDTDIHECVCMEGFDRCLDRCVDTQTDPLFCGDCMTFCGSREVCQAGTCADLGDCRTNGIGCSGLTYCDSSTGDCLPGCVQDDQCGAANEVCDTDINDCVCDTGFERCPPIAGACVDTQTDPLFCGDCGTACGTGEVCQAGACFDPSDCRTNGIGCSGFTYCDPSTGVCLPGCVGDAQCTGANESCDVPSHACVCDSGFERCPPIFGLCVDTQTDPAIAAAAGQPVAAASSAWLGCASTRPTAAPTASAVAALPIVTRARVSACRAVTATRSARAPMKAAIPISTPVFATPDSSVAPQSSASASTRKPIRLIAATAGQPVAAASLCGRGVPRPDRLPHQRHRL